MNTEGIRKDLQKKRRDLKIQKAAFEALDEKAAAALLPGGQVHNMFEELYSHIDRREAIIDSLSAMIEDNHERIFKLYSELNERDKTIEELINYIMHLEDTTIPVSVGYQGGADLGSSYPA